MGMLRSDIVISGGSYAGLTLALALAKTLGPEIAITVIDRQVVPTGRDVRAFAISAGPRHMLDVLGIWPKVRDEAQEVLEIQLTDSPLEAGVRPVLLTYDNTLENGEPASFIVPNEALATALENAADAEPAIQILRPAARVRRAAYLAELGWERLRKGEADDPAELVPLYLRDP